LYGERVINEGSLEMMDTIQKAHRISTALDEMADQMMNDGCYARDVVEAAVDAVNEFILNAPDQSKALLFDILKKNEF
jgi:hypothetical protein